MTLYVAYNGAHSLTTALAVALTYAPGNLCALQIAIPSGQQIELAAWGYTFGEDPTAAVASNGVQLEIASTATATTGLTTHTTTTVKPWDNPVMGRASSMTMGTGATGYSNTATIVSNTTLRYADRRFVPPTSSMDLVWPDNMRPRFGAAAAAEYVQLRVATVTVTPPMIAYIIWNEF